MWQGRWWRFVAQCAALVFATFANTGCSQQIRDTLLENQPPTVRLTHAPVRADSRVAYQYRMSWFGDDPDGQVDYYLYAVDPANTDRPDSTWKRTTDNQALIDFTAREPEVPIGPDNGFSWPAGEPHVFAIRAVDNHALQSATASAAFFSTTLAPYVRISSPTPTSNLDQFVPPTFRVRWSGNDPDGPTNSPTYYMLRLFGQQNPDHPEIGNFIEFMEQYPDSFRRMYAPGFPGWTRVPGDAVTHQFNDLSVYNTYMFAITGFDTAGAYDPVFSRSKNMLRVRVTYAGQNGPIISMYNEYFSYEYPAPGYRNTPDRYYRLEVPANRKLTFYWRARAAYGGGELKQSRWVLDLEDLSDETERTDVRDWYHWSQWSVASLSATIGPFNPPAGRHENHLFFVECEDVNGLKSLGIIQFTVLNPSFANDLLMVQDARLQGDLLKSDGTYQPPPGTWPSKAELDTFFYARGGFPWRGAYQLLSPPPLSPQGIFDGYAFDTVSVRQFPDGIIPLSLLDKYKCVIWYCDNTTAANWQRPPSNASLGAPVLFVSSTPGKPNTLATYLAQGGSVWLFGGGSARATLQGFVLRSGTPDVFTPTEGELVPGRLMYEFPHWRSAIQVNRNANEAALMWDMFGAGKPNASSPSRGWPGSPQYSRLATMYLSDGRPGLARRTSPVLDPAPPLRTVSAYHASSFIGEGLIVPNAIVEDLRAIGAGDSVSTLDTLYLGVGLTLDGAPMMTYYHGLDAPAQNSPHAKIVFSGFPIWYFRREHQIQLVDFVLQDIWGLTRAPAGSRAASVRAARTAPPATGTADPRIGRLRSSHR